MDTFGSNATPMGGGLGRADAIIRAVEEQQAEGCLHLFLFLCLQAASQYATLQEFADMFEKLLLNIDTIKQFHSYVRCASLPDPGEVESERVAVEQQCPAYALDPSLSLLPAEFWIAGREQLALHPWEATVDGALAASSNSQADP